MRFRLLVLRKTFLADRRGLVAMSFFAAEYFALPAEIRVDWGAVAASGCVALRGGYVSIMWRL